MTATNDHLVVVRDPADNGVLMTFGPLSAIEAHAVLDQKRNELKNVNIGIEAVGESYKSIAARWREGNQPDPDPADEWSA